MIAIRKNDLEQLRELKTQLEVLKAEELVFAFADVMAEAKEWILDARRLPTSKRRIAQAFNTLIEYYERLRVTDNATFIARDGDGFLEQVHALRLRISDFQEIDPEDRSLVIQVNATGGFKDLEERLANGDIPPDERASAEERLRTAHTLFQKYFQRGMNEDAFLLTPDPE